MRSITVCLRLDIFSKKRHWRLNYDCVSISTEMSMMSGNDTTRVTNETGATSAMSSSQMTMTTTTTMMTTKAKNEDTTRDVEVITVPGTESATIVDID